MRRDEAFNIERKKYSYSIIGIAGHISLSTTADSTASYHSTNPLSTNSAQGQSVETSMGHSTASSSPPKPTSQSTLSSTSQLVETHTSAPSPTSSQCYFPSSASSISSPTSTGVPILVSGADSNKHKEGGWNSMAGGIHIGIIISVVVGALVILGFLFWCCGGRGWWRKMDGRKTDMLPLYTTREQVTGARQPREGVLDTPPVYEEVAPPEHHTIAGGIRDANEVQRIENESAVVSDGKIPLSEILFVDIVLERHVSESDSSGSTSRAALSRYNEERQHHGMNGDRAVHANS